MLKRVLIGLLALIGPTVAFDSWEYEDQLVLQEYGEARIFDNLTAGIFNNSLLTVGAFIIVGIIIVGKTA